jgi:hypothetical protein
MRVGPTLGNHFRITFAKALLKWEWPLGKSGKGGVTTVGSW